MSEPVNLRQVRKARARAEKRAAGDANAAKFGRTPAERERETRARAKADRHLDGHKRSDTD